MFKKPENLPVPDFNVSQFDTVYTRRIRSKIKRLQTIAKTPLTDKLSEQKLLKRAISTNTSNENNTLTVITNNLQSTSMPKPPSNNQIANIPTSNRFGILDNESDIDKDIPTTQTPMETNTGNDNTDQNKHKNIPNKQKEEKPPPIVISSQIKNYKQFHTEIKNTIGDKKFTIKYNPNSTVITATTIEDHIKLVNEFKKRNVQFHTYTIQGQKQHKIVLKAAPHLEDEEIKSFFETRNIDVLACMKLKSRKGQPSSSFLIKTNQKEQMKQLKSNSEIDHIKIRWEDYVKKNPVSQCWNYQQVGHGSSNCNKTTRCLKCSENHRTRDCPIQERSEENRTKLKCSNCGGPHPANYRNCPYIQQHLNKINTVSTKSQVLNNRNKENTVNFKNDTNNFPLRNKNRFIQSNENKNQTFTYAQSVKNTPNSGSDTMTLLNEIKSLNSSCNISQLIQLIRELKQGLQQIQNPIEKIEFLLYLVEKYNI